MRHVLALGLVLACAALARAEEGEKAFAADYEKLQKEYEAREREFWKPFTEAKSDEERVALPIDMSKHPCKVYAPRFLALWRRCKETALGFKIACLLASQPGDLDGDDSRAIVHEFETRYLAFPDFDRSSVLLMEMGSSAGYENVASVLSSIATRAPDREARACAAFTLGELHERFQKLDRAKEAFSAVERDFADTPYYATRAKQWVFKLTYLVLGKVAPDFEAEDEKGQKFKLSDYRGKVVVLDFWGFW